jgi:decaprenylphospho-beta-D-ribofuranose 2-oxidase
VARGLGRSYGDAAQSAGGTVVDTSELRTPMNAGPVMKLGAGESLDSIMRGAIPKGWFVPVTPGTRYVTVGGAIACDVHGKNHHVDGTFGQHVRALDLVLADGSTQTVTPTSDPDLFWATVGGMGLTGVITSARVAMRPIETAYMSVDTQRLNNLDDLFAAMVDADRTAHYSVACVDTLAKGAGLGRSVLTTGDHAPLQALSTSQRTKALEFSPEVKLKAPAMVPSRLLNRMSVSAFNEVWFRKAPRLRKGEIQSITEFFHPLDGVQDWNRIYGTPGFLQYQFVVPDGEHETVRYVLQRLSAAQCPVFLAVLKRFGPANPGMLSFPAQGWTLAVDIPTRVPGLDQLLDELDARMLTARGRIYLAKDSRVSASVLPQMYPRLDDFRAVRDRIDPQRRFASDLSERLGL